jgi:hypothetical protein
MLTQQEQTVSTSTHAAVANEPVGELELKDNVAYITIRPK